MIQLQVCPSTLADGFNTYSPEAQKRLFDGKAVSHYMKVPSPSTDSEEAKEAIQNASRISLSGVQPKFSVLVDNLYLRYTKEGETGTFVLKPRPNGYHILNKDYCAANEHLTMQIASQVFGIETAVNGLCFYANDEAAYLARRFDITPMGKCQLMQIPMETGDVTTRGHWPRRPDTARFGITTSRPTSRWSKT